MPASDPLTSGALAALGLVLFSAFTVETALGFGATLIAVALGSFVLPLERLLPALIPLNLGLSTWLAVRNRRAIAWGFLLRRLLPAMALGLPFGLALFSRADPSLLKRTFGAFLIGLSSIELRRMARVGAGAEASLPMLAERALLIAGGVIHGAFGTGGPMAVYVTGRVLPDKGAYRATLSVLWGLLNTVLVASYAAQGQLDAESATLSAWLVPCGALGLAVGEVAHRRVPVAAFRRAIFVGLTIAGALLLARG